jgi:hypothetical protein
LGAGALAFVTDGDSSAIASHARSADLRGRESRNMITNTIPNSYSAAVIRAALLSWVSALMVLMSAGSPAAYRQLHQECQVEGQRYVDVGELDSMMRWSKRAVGPGEMRGQDG